MPSRMHALACLPPRHKTPRAEPDELRSQESFGVGPRGHHATYSLHVRLTHVCRVSEAAFVRFACASDYRKCPRLGLYSSRRATSGPSPRAEDGYSCLVWTLPRPRFLPWRPPVASGRAVST